MTHNPTQKKQTKSKYKCLKLFSIKKTKSLSSPFLPVPSSPTKQSVANWNSSPPKTIFSQPELAFRRSQSVRAKRKFRKMRKNKGEKRDISMSKRKGEISPKTIFALSVMKKDIQQGIVRRNSFPAFIAWATMMKVIVMMLSI